MNAMTTKMDRGTTVSTVIYAVGASDDKTSIVTATVSKQDHLPTQITSRRGDVINVSDDALDSLIIALQLIQKQIQTGIIKKGNN